MMQDAISIPVAFLLTGEVARELQVSPETVRKWDRQGKLRAVMTTASGVRLFSREQVDQMRAERDAAHAAEPLREGEQQKTAAPPPAP